MLFTLYIAGTAPRWCTSSTSRGRRPAASTCPGPGTTARPRRGRWRSRPAGGHCGGQPRLRADRRDRRCEPQSRVCVPVRRAVRNLGLGTRFARAQTAGGCLRVRGRGRPSRPRRREGARTNVLQGDGARLLADGRASNTALTAACVSLLGVARVAGGARADQTPLAPEGLLAVRVFPNGSWRVIDLTTGRTRWRLPPGPLDGRLRSSIGTGIS